MSFVKIDTVPDPDGTLQLGVQFANAGNTPAFHVHGRVSLRTVLPTDPPVTFRFNESEAKGEMDLLPRAVEPNTLFLKGRLTPENVKALMSGQVRAYIGAELWYSDAWGMRHDQRFCQYFQPESGKWVGRKPDKCED